MEIELKDILPFYNGQQIKCYHDTEKKEFECVATIISVDSTWIDGLRNPWPIRAITTRGKGEHAYELETFFHWDYVLPMLSPLSKLTEEDAIELTKPIVIYGDLPDVRKYTTYRNSYRQIVVSWGDGAREKYVPENEKHFTSEQFLILCKKGFDVFDLHAQGLCSYEYK